MKELLQSYIADWMKDELKYGHYESVPPPTFENQIFEGPDTDVETAYYPINHMLYGYRAAPIKHKAWKTWRCPR
ncbi:hypothetical protein M758_10G093600 [Ceratodon purpureus]|nr:hypothetical protein M758_10G093600 [Ceratodon purpureus]